MLSNKERTIIAKMAFPIIWEANQPAASDRSIALSMLISNLEHEERENKTMLYSCGTLTPDQLAEGKKIWGTVEKVNRGFERQKILDIVNSL